MCEVETYGEGVTMNGAVSDRRSALSILTRGRGMRPSPYLSSILVDIVILRK